MIKHPQIQGYTLNFADVCEMCSRGEKLREGINEGITEGIKLVDFDHVTQKVNKHVNILWLGE